MANESLPHQLTVKQLKPILESAQDKAVVCLRLPPGYAAHPELGALANLDAGDKGPIVTFTPQNTVPFMARLLGADARKHPLRGVGNNLFRVPRSGTSWPKAV